jgi:hypothetical protein
MVASGVGATELRALAILSVSEERDPGLSLEIL